MPSLPSPAVSFFLNIFLQILVFSLPPFRYRSAIFVPLLVVTAVQTHSGPVTSNPQIIYAVGSLWPTYISTIDRLLFGTAELRCWADGDAPGEAATWGFGWRKIKWSVKLFSDQRGVRWNFRVKGMRSARRESPLEFIFSNIAWVALLIPLYDLCYTFVLKEHERDDRGLHLSTAAGGLSSEGIARKAAIAWVNWSGMEINLVLVATVAVASGLFTSEDWPPFFGALEDFTTVGSFWGRIWHQTLRRTLTAYSSAALRALNIPRSSRLARPFSLLVAFTISGLGHALPLRVMEGATQAHLNSIVIFYLLQAGAIYLESIVIAVYKHTTGDTGRGGWRRVVGLMWCIQWFAATLPLFWDSMIAVEVYKGNSLPISGVEVLRGWWKGA